MNKCQKIQTLRKNSIFATLNVFYTIRNFTVIIFQLFYTTKKKNETIL